MIGPVYTVVGLLGERLMENADRVAGLNKVVPGFEARDGFRLDDLEFEYILRVKPPSET